MAGNGNRRSSISYYVSSIDARELESILVMIRREHLTGSLIINFSQGSPSGMLEWKERADRTTDDRSSHPISSLVK